MLGIRPFFCYFGGKWRSAPHYPPPRYRNIVEPFAGAAGYSLRYPDRQVTLCEADPTLISLWRWLIHVSPSEIRSLPLIRNDQTVHDLHCIPEARALIGFWLNKGMTAPCRTPSKWMRDGWRPNSQWGEVIRERIASQVDRIRHWTIIEGYEHAPNIEATWFVDPPYSNAAGRRYKCNAVDYPWLASWCRSRLGQVMVCENEGANWLPFKPFRIVKGMEGRNRAGKSVEVLWQDPLSEMLS